MPTSITLRSVKGTSLTHTEVDDNFSNLKTTADSAAPAASPALTGTPTAPTAATGTNTTQIATTAFVQANSVNKTGDTITGNTVISVNTSGNALRITQEGSGNALVVEDSANPDSTPFVIDTNGRVIAGATQAYDITTGAGVFSPRLQVQVATSNSPGAGYGSYNWATGTGSGYFVFAKSRGGTIGSHSIVSSGDIIGVNGYHASDGTNFVQAAQIFAAVDGTPATDSMPGRLVFSTTASGASSPTERMRIDSSGRVGIGTAPSVGVNLQLNKTLTGATTGYSYLIQGAIQSDVTGQAFGVYSGITTAASSFTISNLHHFNAQPATFGAGSIVTNQFGFHATSSLTGATNNYGFYSNIASGTSRTITNVERTSNVVTITTSVAHGYTAGQSVTVAATTNTGLNGTFTIASVPTTTTFTYAQTGTDIASGADTGSTVVVGRWNFYANGSAPNAFAGLSRFGAVTTPLNTVDITGSLGRGAPVTKTGNFTLAATENWIICNGSGSITVTLPAASSWTGRELTIKTRAAQTVVSASSNVVPLDSGTAGTAILAGTAGKWATLVSDGTNWVIMQAN